MLIICGLSTGSMLTEVGAGTIENGIRTDTSTPP